MKKLILILMAVTMLFVFGCSSNMARMEKSALNTTIQLDKSQYEIVGDISGKADITTILMIFPIGVQPNYGVLNTPLNLGDFMSRGQAESQAIYNAIQSSKVDAIIAPKYTYKTTMFLPFYIKETCEVTGKGIKLK